MSDILAPVFEDRATRLSSFSDEQRSQLELTAKNSGDPEFLDRQFSAMWLSRRTGLPHDEVVKNFDGLSRLYFGEGATPSKAYDSISGLYKKAGASSVGSGETGGEMATGQQASPYSVSGTVIAKDIAGSLSAGAAKMGYDALGGIYSNLASATGVKLKRPRDSAEYNDLMIERGMLTLEADTLGISASAYGIKKGSDEYKTLFAGVDTTAADARLVEIKKRTAEIEAQVKAENDAILDEIDRNDFKWMASKGVEVLRGVSNLFYELSQESPSAMGVRPEFTDTIVGNLTQTAGSLPVTALFAYLGPVVGGGATYGSIYGQVEQERKQFQGDAYDPQRAFLANAASAGPQAVLEFAFGMERVLGNVLKATPKIGGRVAFGDALKVMGKRGLATGGEEFITEPSQSFWNDYVASLSYDEKRELLTPEAFKQRAIEGLTAFAFGSLFGAGVSGIDLVDRNRGVAKAEQHLTTRNGQSFTPYDWAALRTAKTDEEIKGMAPDPGMADVYLAAANGNPEAQAAYFKDVQERAFVETDGLSAHGVTIGKVKDGIAIRDENGVLVLDPNNKDQMDWFLQLQADAVQAKNELEQREGATSETIKEFEKRFGDQVQIERMQMQKLSELMKSGVIKADQEADALAAAHYINNAISKNATDADVPGISDLTFDEKTGAIRMAAKIAEGAEPMTVVEEVSESWYKKAIVEGKLDPAELTAHRQKWHTQEGESDPVAEGKVSQQRADIEWFSKRVIDYALANRKVELPGGWGKWLRTLGKRLKAILRGAARMKKLLRDGKIDPQLEQWMQQALGAKPEESDAKQVQQNGEPGGLMSTFNLEQKDDSPQSGPIDAVASPGSLVFTEHEQSNIGRAKALFGSEEDGWEYVDPIVVVNNSGERRIIDGHNRASAAKELGLKSVKIREINNSTYADLKARGYDNIDIAAGVHEAAGDFEAASRLYEQFSGSDLRSRAAEIVSILESPNPSRTDEGPTFSLGNVENKPVAPANFLGIQPGIPGRIPDLELWNLTESIKGHGAGSTVSRQTIEKAGFYLPPAPKQDVSFSLAQTETPEFKKWFGESKVVDAQGKPLVVYHGTNQDFSKFSKARLGKNTANIATKGFFFTENASEANEYAEFSAKRQIANATSVEVQVEKLKQQIASAERRGDWNTVENLTSQWEDLELNAIRDDITGAAVMPVFLRIENPMVHDFQNTVDTHVLAKLIDEAKANGHDGMQLLNVYDPVGNRTEAYSTVQWIAFKPTQIKSATGNRGTFSPTNADITFAITGIPQNKTQAMQAKLAQFRAQQAATFPYPYHQLAALPTRARISGKGHDGILLTAFEKNAAPMDERLRYITDRFGVNAPIMYRVRKYDMDKAQLLKKYSEMVAPLMRKLPQMTALDLENWTLAASNQDAMMRDSLTAKYGMQNEWAQFTAARDQLRAEMLAAGIEVGLIDEWFPRWVKDLVGLRESLGIEASDDPFEQAIIDAEKIKGRMLTNEEANDVLDAVVRGINFNGVSTSAPANAKKRKIQTIGKDQFQFYADANHALSRWLEQSTERIARHRFFGKNIVALPSASIIAPTKIDLDASIGAIVREQLEAGNITATQQAELKSIIAGRFGFYGQTAGWLRDIMNVTYGAVLGQFHSALSNALDIVTTVVNYGPVDAAITMPKAIWNNAKNLPIIANSRTLSEAMEKRTKTKGWISRETLGVENVIEQFRDARFTAKAVQEVFKATGFTFMDGIGKEVMINTAFRSLAKKAKRGKLSAKQLATFNAMFGEQAARQVVADFAAGKQTPDTLFAVYNVLADWQPISLSQYPENYARHPNARFMWMLKIFAMKQLSAYKREGQLGAWFGDTKEAAGKAIKGDMKGAAKAFGLDFGTKAEGARKLTYLLALLVATGASKDWIVDFYLDRDPQMEDEVLDNMFKIMAVSRYVVWNNRNRLHAEGTYGFVEGAAKLSGNSKQILGDILTPPFWTLIERPAKDVAEFAKMQSEGADYDWAGSESVQFLPGIGAPIYWYSDKGKGKVERRRQLRERDRNPRRRRDRD